MSALREARSGSIAVEQRRNFAGKWHNSSHAFAQAKRPKVSSWTHKFFCLAKTEKSRVPSNTLQRNELVLAGLGERKVMVADVNCSPQEFRETLLTEFPKLRKGGGFELLKCSANWNLFCSPSAIHQVF